MTPLHIREATLKDHGAIWAIIAPVIAAGDTYALERDLSRGDALDYWLGADRLTFVAEADGAILGTYYLRANQRGGGAHVANAGYVTAAAASGRGVARAMAAHSFEAARAHGYAAMQFNAVVATNTRAVRLWRALGFAVVGTVPNAFVHPQAGLVDLLVMHRAL